MRFSTLLTAAASVAALSFSSAAMAQSTTMKPPVTPPSSEAPKTNDGMINPIPAPPEAVADPTSPDDSPMQPAMVPGDSPTPAGQAYLLKAGDPTVTSNPPVPDTPEVRAAFGGPDSHGGKTTKPVGN